MKRVKTNKTEQDFRTQHGNFSAYEPQWLDGTEWKRVPYTNVPMEGYNRFPAPLLYGGITEAINLCGYMQAWAIAYNFAAIAEANGKRIEVRLQDYEVQYDIKCRKG